MNVVVRRDYEELSHTAALAFAQLVRTKPHSSVVLATGNTPMGMYDMLTRMKEKGEFDPSKLRIFQLDGYLGLTPEDSRSLEGWLRRAVLQPWGISNEKFVRLPEDTLDAEASIRSYIDEVQQAGGFDIAVLGLGPNGHLGFNEPPSHSTSPTRVVTLTEESIRSNALYWGGEERVPRQSITAGMDILLQSKAIMLLVSGVKKKDILTRTLSAPMQANTPSSYLTPLQSVTIFTDEACMEGQHLSSGEVHHE